jgi:hypothetical protein
MESEPTKEKSKKYLSYNTVMIVGIAFLGIKIIIGGTIGDFVGLAGMIFSLVSIIMIIIQTFQKSVTKKTKLIGWGLIILWVIEMIIIGSMSKN